MLNADEVRDFIHGREVFCFDPQSRAAFAVIHYTTEGRCIAKLADGQTDEGVYSFDGDSYWTQYTHFRDGVRHGFRLEPIGPGLAQAYFVDGTIALLQSHTAALT